MLASRVRALIHTKCYGSTGLLLTRKKARSLQGTMGKPRVEPPIREDVALSLTDAEATVSMLLMLDLDVAQYDVRVDVLYD